MDTTSIMEDGYDIEEIFLLSFGYSSETGISVCWLYGLVIEHLHRAR